MKSKKKSCGLPYSSHVPLESRIRQKSSLKKNNFCELKVLSIKHDQIALKFYYFNPGTQNEAFVGFTRLYFEVVCLYNSLRKLIKASDHISLNFNTVL
jgi:hypothetical protein